MSKTHYLSLFPNSSGPTLPGTENIGRLFYKTSAEEGLYVCTPAGWELVSGSSGSGTITISWDDITDKPTTFSVDSHTHNIADITGLQSILDSKINTADINTYLNWDNITNKPTTYASTTHVHAVADITGLQSILDGLATKTDLSGKEDKTNKGAVNGYAPLNGNAIVPTNNLGTGNATTTTYLRGDGTWATLNFSAGTVQGFGVKPSDGIVATIDTPTTTPILNISLGNITPDSVNTPSILHTTGITFKIGNSSLFNINSTETTFTAGIKETIISSVVNSTYTVDLSTGTLFDVTLNANCTYTFPAVATSRGKQFTIFQTQGTTPRAVVWPTSVKWPGDVVPTITATANKIDIFSFVCDGTRWFGFVSGLNYTKT